MDIKNIKATNLELTPALREYIIKRFGDLDKFVSAFINEGREIAAWVEVGKTTKHHRKGDYFFAELTIEAGGQRFLVSSKTFDVRAAIDEVKDEMSRQLRARRGRQTSLYLRGARAFKRLTRLSPLAWFRRKKGERDREEGL